MKEYQIEVTSVTTVYVEADNEEEALEKAYEKALRVVPDSNDAIIVDVIEDEEYIPSSENGDYGPSNPWDAPGMSVKDFI